MKLVHAIVCTTAAVGAACAVPATASASAVHCVAAAGEDATVIEGRTGCRAAGDGGGQARSIGIDGVGYAGAPLGSRALGVGAAGGVGASESVAGASFAVGLGPDAVALATGADSEPEESSSRTVAIALGGSRTEVSGGPTTSVVCLGAGAFAWDERSGAACLATPFGVWNLPGDSATDHHRHDPARHD